MARVAIVSYDVQTIRGKASGVAAFTTRWARLLREAGDDVTIVMTRIDHEPMSVDPPWRARYQQWGIGLIELQSPKPLATRWPEVPTLRIAEIAAPVLKNFDIVYLQDWGNPGFHLLRERRYTTEPGPVCVTVLHGPSEWELSSNEQYPDLPAGLHLAYQERYCAQHSDFVVSPSRYMVGHLQSLGWNYPGEVEVLGLPMPEPPANTPSAAPSALDTIVYFARVEERKGIRTFTKALQLLATESTARPSIVLLGASKDPALLDFALRSIHSSGYAVKHIASLDSEQAIQYLRDHAPHSLCVVPSRADNHPYALVEASLIPGLNLIACNGGGVPEVLQHAAAQLCDPFPRELATRITERLHSPLSATGLAQYNCRTANENWLAFHRKALATARPPRTLPPTKPTVDVCTTYFQKAPYLPQLVDALEHQTDPAFHLIAVNDGSPDPESNRVFDEQATRVAPRGWDFFTQPNAFVDAARNAAAARGHAEYILFVDADDVPAHNAVARLRDAIALSGDDALICSSYLFASDKPPFVPTTGEITVPAYATCIPLGVDLIGGLLDPASFGGSMFIVRRSAFEAVGGFHEVRGAGHEDWELYVRLALAGYKVDVLPELLQFYRQVEGSLARTLHSQASLRRLLAPYEEHMTAAGLPGAAIALAGLNQGRKDMEAQIKRLTAKSNAPRSAYAFFPNASRRFEPEPTSLSFGRLQSWYRNTLSLETRLKIHRTFLAPFLGPYQPPSA